MITLKGVYEWKLIDANTRKTINSGKQENLITDNGLLRLLGMIGFSSNKGNPWGGSTHALIFISSTVIDPNVDYRLTYAGMNGITLDNEITMTNTTRAGTFYQGEVNFNPPISPLTIRVIGLRAGSDGTDLLSFIELTTPITQQTNQFLFIRYRVESSYTGSGTNGIVNTFVTNRVNNRLMNLIYLNDAEMILTPFKKPVDFSLCGRITSGTEGSGLSNIFQINITDEIQESLSYKYEDSFTITEVPGVHASSQIAIPRNSTGLLGGVALAIAQYPDTPTIGTVFAHAVGDVSVFSNPGNPPLSRGNIVISGTSTATDIFKKISMEITQSGEANDVPDVNTGKYKYGVNAFETINVRHICPLELGGNSLESLNWEDTDPDSPSQGIIVGLEKVSWAQYATNGFMYFSQNYSSLDYICKWRFNTHETGVEVIQLQNNVAVLIGTDLWIGTDNGLVQFDTVTDTVTDTYTVSGDGLLNDICTDIVYDDVNDILWIGHSNGLTRFNPTLGTVTSTHTTLTAPFTSLTSAQIAVYKGQLSARAGFLCRGGNVLQSTSDDVESPWVYDSNTNTLVRIPRTNFTNSRCGSVTLVGDGTGDIIVDSTIIASSTANTNGKISKWNVVPSAPSFSLNQATTYNIGDDINDNCLIVKLIRISNNQFMGIGFAGLSSIFAAETTFIIDYYVPTATASSRIVNTGYSSSVTTSGFNYLMNMSKIDSDDVTLMWLGGLLLSSGMQQLFGWNGSSWSKDFTGSKDIPDSSEISLVNGLTVNFENAIGFPANQQFISGENLMFVTGPGRIKSNLQTMSTKSYYYLGDMVKIIERAVTIPAVSPYTYRLPEASGVDFKALETDEDYIVIEEDPSLLIYDKVLSTPSPKQYVVNPSYTFTVSDVVNNIISVAQDFSGFVGGRVRLSSTATIPPNLRTGNPYYVIFVDSTHIKLAISESDALAGIAVDLTGVGSGTHTLVAEGLFVFNSADAGEDIKLSCQYIDRH